jgi:hypothetical protein
MNARLAEYLKTLPYKAEVIEAWPPFPSRITLSNRSWHITICDPEGDMDIESFKQAFNEEMLKKLKNEADFYASLHETYKKAVDNYTGFLK